MGIPTLSLEGKVAIVTGGKRGIGRGIALAFAKAGADVAICSRGAEDGSLEAVAKEIEQLGRRSLAIKADVSKKSDVDQMVQRVIDEFGDIDILVNNAGVIMWDQSLLEASEDDWNKIMTINLQGAFFCCQAVGKWMMERKKGNIINMCSVSAISVSPGAAIYCISKAGLWMLTRALAQELGVYNIRVNAISPGWVKTDMNIQFRRDPDAEKEIARGIPLERLGVPEDIGRVALFLASDASDYITGQSIIIDGGINDTVFAGAFS
jgi:3-oxoacyl-[acyl-carrier protein] reductase